VREDLQHKTLDLCVRVLNSSSNCEEGECSETEKTYHKSPTGGDGLVNWTEQL
jgi:hypothetical protein